MRVILQVAATLRDADEADPLPYRLLRTMRWTSLQTAPPDTNGTTQIPAPDAQERTALEQLLDRGAHRQLLDVAEQTFQAGPFHLWLDLQYLMFRAASTLGDQYTAVADALRHDTAALLRRLPALASLSFRDGPPFAGPATQGWLDTIGPTAADTADPAAGDADALSDVLDEARTVLSEQSLDEAIMLLENTDGDASARTRFRRRLYSAMLCLNGGNPSLARILLESLNEDVTAYRLAHWEPALAKAVWERLYMCYTRLHNPDEGRDFTEPSADIYRKLCDLDLTTALSLPSLPSPSDASAPEQ